MDLIAFAQHVNKLKAIKRAGWVEKGIADPESVADHSFSLALLVMVMAPRYNLDQLKCLQMALIHDLSEAIVGDIIIMRNGISQGGENDKAAAELTAIKSIFSSPGEALYEDIFIEYQRGESAEAKLVKELDKLDMTLMAREYEDVSGINLEEFLIFYWQRAGRRSSSQTLSGFDFTKSDGIESLPSDSDHRPSPQSPTKKDDIFGEEDVIFYWQG